MELEHLNNQIKNKGKTELQLLRFNYIKFLVEFKYIEFKYFGKDNIVCVSLVNATMYLNSIGNLMYLT
jgi:hypothetical protein